MSSYSFIDNSLEYNKSQKKLTHRLGSASNRPSMVRVRTPNHICHTIAPTTNNYNQQLNHHQRDPS